MARIRSIKPEFWTDGSNMLLSDACALFFIGLWNFCDDEGKHRLSLEQLCAELGGRWRKDKVSLFLLCLAKSGQIRVSINSEWIQTTGWSHQKIDKPRQPEVKSESLKWFDAIDSAKALESSRTINARIGSDRRDRIGSDRSSRGVQKKIDRGIAAIAEAPKSLGTQECISHYCRIWKEKYPGSKCDILGKDAGIVKRTVKHLGVPRTIKLLESYFNSQDPWYLEKRHDLTTFERDIKKIADFGDSGRQVNRKAVLEAEDAQHFQTKYEVSEKDKNELAAIFGTNSNLLVSGDEQ